MQTSDKRKHGKHSTYSKGCRCEPCTVAHRVYTREYLRRVRRAKQGVGPPVEPKVISANEARRHLLHLKKHGIGCRHVADKTGISYKAIQDIRSGRKKGLWRETEKKILDCFADDFSDNHYVDSTYTRMLIQELFDAGYTLTQINKIRGKTPAQKVVTGKSIRLRKQKEIERIHFQLLRRPPHFEKPRTVRKGQMP